MSRPIPPDAQRVKTSTGLRLAAAAPERDARGRLLTAAQAKHAQRLRMLAADEARVAATAAMLPAYAPLAGATPTAPAVDLSQRGTIQKGGSRK